MYLVSVYGVQDFEVMSKVKLRVRVRSLQGNLRPQP